MRQAEQMVDLRRLTIKELMDLKNAIFDELIRRKKIRKEVEKEVRRRQELDGDELTQFVVDATTGTDE